MSPNFDPKTTLAKRIFKLYYYELKSLGGKWN